MSRENKGKPVTPTHVMVSTYADTFQNYTSHKIIHIIVVDIVISMHTGELPTSGNVRGITSWNDELFVVIHRSPDIDVYDI